VRSDRIQLALVSVIAATSLLSIFACEIALFVALLVFAYRIAMRRADWPRLPVDGPLLAFSVWTLLSASFSPSSASFHEGARKLVLLPLLYLTVETCAHERSRERVLTAALLAGLALGLESILQFYFLGFDALSHRPKGFLGHYMTASGLEAGALVLAGARLLFGRHERPKAGDLRLVGGLLVALTALTFLQQQGFHPIGMKWTFVAGLVVTAIVLSLARGPWPGASTATTLALATFAACSWALVLSQTRNTWLGSLAALISLAILRAPRTLYLLAAGVAFLLILRPATVMSRLTLKDDSSLDRYYMMRAGLDMIRDAPVFGQGPGRILEVYPTYRWPEARNPNQPHLHNNFLQIAAERGLPCLAFWIWLMVRLLLDAGREARAGRGESRWAAAAAFGMLVGLLGAGLFEYNFGDSEVLLLLLVVSAMPYALRRERRLRLFAPRAA
jgi:O-antigen ligase